MIRMTFFEIPRNEKGQMAIFIALIFQALFMLFAMALNIAMFVHDKINLQNAVDLGAYYAAQKQAEVFNVIAHQNYQIRQAYKLLAWRYRVVGGIADSGHPSNNESNSAPKNDSAKYYTTVEFAEPPAELPGNLREPAICIANKRVWQYWDNDNLCDLEYRGAINRLPNQPRIANAILGPLLDIVESFENATNQKIAENCPGASVWNWLMGAWFMNAYRFDQANRRQVIWALADNLSADTGDFLDIDGQSVYEGVSKTIEKNLTVPNFEGGIQVEMLNSLGGIPRDQWLVDVEIEPMLAFQYFGRTTQCPESQKKGLGQDTEVCCQSIHRLDYVRPDAPERGDFINALNAFDTNGNMRANYFGNLDNQRNDFQGNPHMRYSIGVEKNPWYMAYVGVQARTTPRQLFFPFGRAITVTARAYAKPFGGRIGPWFGKFWGPGDLFSQGQGDNRTDQLLPPRVLGFEFLSSTDAQSPLVRPNFSRFPGDTLGLSGGLGLSALGSLRSPQGSQNKLLQRRYYNEINMLPQRNQPVDYLAANPQGGPPPEIRNYEIAAIVPDIYDITYYSIEPDFARVYLPRLQEARTSLNIPSGAAIRGDLGWVQGGSPFSVKDQIQVANGLRSRRSQAFYFVEQPSNLLTSWIPSSNEVYDYSIQGNAPQYFGQCETPPGSVPNPGDCVVGGRTGYSVKMVSRKSLREPMSVGGQGTAESEIINPPPDDGGW